MITGIDVGSIEMIPVDVVEEVTVVVEMTEGRSNRLPIISGVNTLIAEAKFGIC